MLKLPVLLFLEAPPELEGPPEVEDALAGAVLVGLAVKLRLRGSCEEAGVPEDEERDGPGVRQVSYPAEEPGGTPPCCCSS